MGQVEALKRNSNLRILVALGVHQGCLSEGHYFDNNISVMTTAGDLTLALARKQTYWFV